ncbi:hypothetical protein NQ317_017333 [Molorchus minor]|uniref:Apolipophorin n=1 Tax=Molorchus minor TaxID=1323400 RepID=A0ABQ9K0J1_9CUCU|nr:hypothetical protein NQ317_017333 [Molorchus minor]
MSYWLTMAIMSNGMQRRGPQTSQNFKYALGTTYKYNYEGRIDIDLSSAEGQQTTTEVKAVVLLTQEAECNLLLRLQNVQVLGANGKKFGHIPDIEKPIRINFHDGHVEDRICVEPGDNQNSINVKRAIASLFQANLKNNYETDVFGVCPTETAHHKEGNVLVIQKSRNLDKCSYRENLKQDFFATTFNLNSEIKSSPILNSDYNGKLRVKNGILDSASVVENYLYTPFSVGKNGAKAQVTSKIQLTGTSAEKPTHKCSEPRTIIFENPHPVVASTVNVNTILSAVKDVVGTINNVVGENTASKFITLVKTVRSARKDDLLAVYNQVKSGVGFSDKATAKKTFLDALLQSGTGDTIEVAITLLRNNEFSDVEKKLVYFGLSLVRHATESSITAATVISPTCHTKPTWGIGNLVGRFCSAHSCHNVDAINRLTQKLLEKVPRGKAANREQENESIYALKALRNFGFISEATTGSISTIVQDKKVSNRLRVTAIESILAEPCTQKLRDLALRVLQDIQEDSEVRINAYLVVAKCPNAHIGNAIKTLLEKEQSYQVGGFIVSHIRNIKASANPDKDLAKHYLGFSVPKRFPIDFRKWSYNAEFSYAVDTLGIAASTETNIIYSQDSFLPRSSSLNLTAELFGHTFNFLEIQTRQENLDRLVEHYFGPKGLLKTSSLNDLFRSGSETAQKAWSHLEEKLQQTLRARRDVSRAEIDGIGKAVQIKENELNKDLDLDLSVKAFGSEILFTNFNVYQKGLTPEAVIDKLLACFATGLDKLKHFEETLRSNILFLDVEFAYPTGLGFPLRLAVEGTSNIQLKAKGGVDIRTLLAANKDSNVRIQLIPSANIEVGGRLTVDALVVENGLKVVSTLYTATGGDLNINLFNGAKGVDVKFGLPVKEQKLVSASHEIVFHTREQAGQETNTPLKFAQAKDFSICFDHLNPFIGLVFCGEINGPNLAGKDVPVLPFPLAGDAKAAVTIDNEDLYEFHIRSVSNNALTSSEFVIETIGNNRQKKVSFQVNAESYPEKYIQAIFTSPIKSASAEVRLISNQKEIALVARVSYDKIEYYGKAGITSSKTGDRGIYKPVLEYRGPGNQQLPIRVEGQLIVEYQKPYKYVLDNIRVVIANDKSYGVKGYITGDLILDPSWDLTVLGGDQQLATTKGRLNLDHAKPLKLNVELRNTINPNVNFHVKGELARQPDKYESSLQLIHGPDLSSKTNIISLSNSVTNKYKNAQNFVLGTKNKLTYPLVGIKTNFDYEQTAKSIEYDFGVQYNDVKFGSELDIKINEKEQGDFDVEFELYGLDNKVEFKANRQIHGEESKIKNELEVNGKKLEVSGRIKHHIKPSIVDLEADLTVVLPTHNTPFKVNSGLKYNPNEVDAHHKVTSGSTVVIDAFLKTNKGGNANGSIKVNIKNVLVVNGQVKSNKGSGTGDILIDAQSLKKQVKIDTTFLIQPDTTYNIDLNIYPSYAQDKSQKIVLSTHNKLSQTNVDSKNQIQILDKKMEVNVKGTRTGDDRNGKVNGEIEVTLPNDQYLLGKLSSDHKVNNELLNAHGQASLEYRKNKNAAGRKVSIKSVYKNTNPNDGLYDVEYNLAADDSNGKNINADIAFKSSKQGESRHLEVKNKIYGSIIKHPLEARLVSNCKDDQHEYEAVTSYGPNAVLKVAGKYNIQGDGKPISGNIGIELNTPSKALKTLKVSGSGSIHKSESPSDTLQIQGQASIFADDDGSIPEPIIDFQGDGQVKVSDKDGVVNGNIRYGKLDPVSASAGYNIVETGKQKQLNGNLNLKYGKDKNLKVDGSLERTSEHQYKLEAEIVSPTEEYKHTKLIVQTKRSDDNSHITSNTKVISDGKTWVVDTEFLSSQISPLVDLKMTCPEGKISQFRFKGNKVSDKELGGELKIIYEKQNFLLEGNVEANLENIEQFYIKGAVNSPSLKLDKVTFEAQNKPGKGSRRIQVTIKSAGKNLVTGSTSYQAREEQGKYVVEGSGSFKIKDETKSANFKYICQQLSQERNGEEGIEVTFDAGLGSKAIDAELKVTNKQFRLQNSYCEAKKECAHIEFDSKINTNEVDAFNQEIEVSVDLRKLGLSHEFGLKSVTNRRNYIIDHTVDIHFQSQENSKYQYSFYVHPNEAGIIFTTPKRVVSLEANANVPKNLRQGGKVSGDISFYLDKKNQPNKKASLNGWLVIDVDRKSINGEGKLAHPGSVCLHQTVYSGTTENAEVSLVSVLDLFNQPNQKVTITYKGQNSYSTAGRSLVIQSSGLGVNIAATEQVSVDKQTYTAEYASKLQYHVGSSNYDNVLSVKASKSHFNFLIRILSVDLLKIVNKMNLNKEEQVIESEVSSYNNNPLISHLEVKNFNTAKYTVGYKNTPRDKLQFNAALIPGQIADVRADHITGGGKVNLYQATLKLDDANFFKPDYSINSKEIEKVLNQAKQKFTEYINGLQNVGKTFSDDIRKEVSQLGDLGNRATPNLKPLRDYYTSELRKIKDEILADKSVKELGEILKKVFGAVASSVSEAFSKVSELVEKVAQSVQSAFAGVIESIDKELIPQLKELAERLTEVAADLAKAVIDIAAAYLATVSQLIEKYQPEIKQLAATFGELGQDVARFIQKAYEQIRVILVEQWKNIYNELKALPIFEEIKEQYEEFVRNGLPNREGLLNAVREVSNTIKEIIPPEFIVRKELVDVIDVLVQKFKINRSTILPSLKKIIQINTELVRKIANAISTPTYDVQRAHLPVSFDFLKKLPKLVAIKFSPIAYLLREDTSEEVITFLLSLFDNPRQWFAPFPLFGMVVQGQHLFTFDGKHLTFPGNCKYLLARDAVNGNFTIIGTYSNGLLSAITLADKLDAITLKKEGQILLNNAPAELPTRKPDLSAFRGYNLITLKSTAGVTVHCTPDLIGCSILVSGFYHGQIKGLLGNGNNEPYDDFTIPSGKIVTSEGEFGNSYKIGNCQPVTVPKHQHAENPECNKLFSWESSLRYCYPFVKTDNFKMACAHGLAAGVKRTEEAIAKAYVAACQQRNIPVSVPHELVQCQNSDKSFSVGESFSVKLPAKAADIVLIIDTVKSNELIYKEFVKPLVTDLIKELNSKGITDVELHLIAYGGENKWPSHVTVNGKLTFKEKTPDLKFTEPEKEESLVIDWYPVAKTYIELIESIIHDLRLAFGQDLQAQTYVEALEYPFRSHATKTLIIANSSPCETGKFALVTLNLITPFEELNVKDPKKTKDVIGFNDEKVFTFTQGKKKPDGTAELYKELQYEDYCVDFTIKNRGNVFVADNFVSSKPEARKQFVHVAAHNVVNQLTNIEEGLDCECKLVNPYNAQNVCRESYAKERSAPARKGVAKG